MNKLDADTVAQAIAEAADTEDGVLRYSIIRTVGIADFVADSLAHYASSHQEMLAMLKVVLLQALTYPGITPQDIKAAAEDAAQAIQAAQED